MIYECKRRRNAGHFTDRRGDIAILHITRGKLKGHAVMAVWGDNSIPDTGAQPQNDGRDFASLKKSEGCSVLLPIIGISH